MSIKLPTISWEVIISNTSVVSGENYRYTCTLSPVNINDPGYGQLEVGYYIVDYIGHIFKIEEVTGYDIKVHDLLEDTQFSGPYNDQNGYVYSSLKEAALVVQAKLNRLDKSAEDFVRSLALDPKILEVDGIAYDTEFESDLDYEGLTKWNPENNTLDIHTGKTAVLQVGQEIHIKVYNDTAETISNGTAVHPTGGYNGFPTIGKALAKTHETINLDYGITTTEIASGEYGFVTWFGKIHNVDTSSYSLGDVLYISPDTAGEVTNVKPTFPNYSIQVGIVFKVGATDGVVFVTGRDDYQNTIRNFWNGTFREPFRFYVTSDGTDITGTLYSDNGYDELTMMFSTGFEMLSLDPNPTVTITAGTDTNPQHNFIYIPLSTKQLTSSTTGFPIEEHIKVACVYVKSAAFTQSEGALKNHNWSDNIQGVLHNQGYLSKITERLRQEHAKWHSGCELSVTVDTNTTPDSVYLSATSGSVYEIIKEAFEAKNMATGDIAHVVNHPTTPWISISNLNELDVTAEGDPLYNHCFSLVVWGVANKATEPSHLKINLPRGTYAKNDAETAINDPYNYSIYEIPDEFTGVGFLIARVTLSVGPAGNVWTLEDLEDLRGQIPNSTAGGGTGGSGASTFLGLGDTPNSYLGHANKVPSVSDDETVLEFTSIRYNNTEPIPEDVGGAEAGTTFDDKTLQEMFTTILYPYQYPSFTAFSIQGQTSPLEVGDSILADRTFIWNTENDSNINTNSINIYDITGGTTLASSLANDVSELVTMSAITKNSEDSNVFKIESTNSKSQQFERSYTVNWHWCMYYGESTDSTLTENDIEALRANELDTTFTGTYSFNALSNGYKYISYPAVWGTATSFTDTSTGLSVPMEDVYTISVTNAYGVTTNYNVHRSTNILNDAINIAIA